MTAPVPVGGDGVEAAIEASSLGTPDAKALRASVSDETAARIVARADELGDIEAVLMQTGVTANTWQSAARRLANENARLRAALRASAPEAVELAIRTLLPGLRVANYVERWSPGSPAVQALSLLSEHVGEGPVQAGDEVDPDVPTAHPRRPAASAPEDGLRAAVEELAEKWQSNAAANAVAGHYAQAYWQNRSNDLRALLADQPPTPDEGGARE